MKERDVTVYIEIEEANECLCLKLDWPRLSYILLNLVSNAIKFSPLYSPVLIRAAVKPRNEMESAKVTI